MREETKGRIHQEGSAMTSRNPGMNTVNGDPQKQANVFPHNHIASCQGETQGRKHGRFYHIIHTAS